MPSCFSVRPDPSSPTIRPPSNATASGRCWAAPIARRGRRRPLSRIIDWRPSRDPTARRTPPPSGGSGRHISGPASFSRRRRASSRHCGSPAAGLPAGLGDLCQSLMCSCADGNLAEESGPRLETTSGRRLRGHPAACPQYDQSQLGRLRLLALRLLGIARSTGDADQLAAANSRFAMALASFGYSARWRCGSSHEPSAY